MCLHGFADTWRTWQLVLPALERRHEVLAPTLAGHAGAPPIAGPVTDRTLADAVERAMDAAGIGMAHIAGNSLGGRVALQLAARGRARSVVALAPAGGWARDDRSHLVLLDRQAQMWAALRRLAPQVDAFLATPDGPRRATRDIVEHWQHIPVDLIAHITCGVAACAAAPDLLEFARHAPWDLDAERITCPVRVVWGAADRLLPWPAAAARLRQEWLPWADWVVLDGVGHCPQLDVPLEAAELILGLTAP